MIFGALSITPLFLSNIILSLLHSNVNIIFIILLIFYHKNFHLYVNFTIKSALNTKTANARFVHWRIFGNLLFALYFFCGICYNIRNINDGVYAMTKKTVLCLLALLLMAFACFPLTVAAASDDAISVTTGCYQNGKFISWQFPYRDSYFEAPDDIYQHSLAQLSLGLSIASVRDLTVATERQGHLIESFLQDAGFDNIDTTSYHSAPETDSVAFALASKKIGDVTLIAVGICSANYGKEWAGNLRVGDETEHTGFRLAANRLKQALYPYIEKYGSTGNTAVWISGFSRAAAVGNLVAADLTESGDLARVYGYFFATPRTTRSPKPLSNLFNVLIKDDVIPYIPLAEWGYERYGIDRFLRSPISDSDISDYSDMANIIQNQITKEPLYYNPTVNFDLRTVVEYLGKLFPTSADYAGLLQDLLINTVQNGISGNFFEQFGALLDKISLEGPENERLLLGLQDYLKVLANRYVYQLRSESDYFSSWDDSRSLIDNLLRVHHPLRYLVFMFACDDPDDLFSDNLTFTRLSLTTDADLEIYDEYGLLERFDGSLTYDESGDRPPDKYAYIDVSQSGNQRILLFPNDKPYKLVLIPKKDSLVRLLKTEYSCKQVGAVSSSLYIFSSKTSLSPCRSATKTVFCNKGYRFPSTSASVWKATDSKRCRCSICCAGFWR